MADRETLDPHRLAPEAANPAVRDVMRPEVAFCLPSTPIDAIAKLMADNDLLELAVLIDRRPVGYVRSRDILHQYVEGGVELGGSDLMRPSVTEVLARDVLRTPPLLVDENSLLGEAIAVLRQAGRQMALVMHEDVRPVGMITMREIAAHTAARVAAGAAGIED
ncbi:MAG TPA: CBS domain-containing protein [Candidatus Dormibacteraeota bacterium]|jgi:CBS domain-containing protein|nr:CBS domain-containing protein [Candidatus Dormibacteraeota bacterium]